MVVEQPKDELNVLALVLPENVWVYAALLDRARLGVNGLELSGVTASSRGGGGGGCGGGSSKGIHGAGVRRFAHSSAICKFCYVGYLEGIALYSITFEEQGAMPLCAWQKSPNIIQQLQFICRAADPPSNNTV